MNIVRNGAIVILAGLAIMSCHSGPPDFPPLPVLQGLPTAAGSMWQYQVSDSTFSLSGQVDSSSSYDVTVMIAGSFSSPAAPSGHLWIATFPDRSDSFDVCVSADTTLLYRLGDYASPVLKIVFPLHLGEKWTGPHSNYQVEATDTMKIGSQRLFPVYDLVESSVGVGNEYGENHIYVVPGLGVAGYTFGIFNTVDPSNRRTAWRLFWYSVAQ